MPGTGTRARSGPGTRARSGTRAGARLLFGTLRLRRPRLPRPVRRALGRRREGVVPLIALGRTEHEFNAAGAHDVMRHPLWARLLSRTCRSLSRKRYRPRAPPSRGGGPCAGIVADGRRPRRVPRNPGGPRLVGTSNPSHLTPRRAAPPSGRGTERPYRPREARPVARTPARLVVLVSGSGTNLQALLDAVAPTRRTARRSSRSAPTATASPAWSGPSAAGVPTRSSSRSPTTPTARTGTPRWPTRSPTYEPDLVVSAGFMKHRRRTGVPGRVRGRFVNTHPALLPSFPGRARAYGTRSRTA